MNAKTFYTKNLKNLINELRKKNCLNEEAVLNVDKEIMRVLKGACFVFLLVLISSVFSLLNASDSFNNETKIFCLLILILLTSLPISFVLEVRKYCDRFAVLITTGKITTGRILKCTKCEYFLDRRQAPHWMFVYKFQDTRGIEHKGKLRMLLKFHNEIYGEGYLIDVIFDEKNAKNNIPVLPWLMMDFNLKKTEAMQK